MGILAELTSIPAEAFLHYSAPIREPSFFPTNYGKFRATIGTAF
jgi:hypothetical protein